MALPQLYRFGREGKWFGTKLFSVFMFEGVVQVSRWSSRLLVKSITMCALQSAIIFFIILYGYFSPSARNDGFDVAQYEFSTAMVISSVMAANLFNGLNTKVWTAWVFFSVSIGIILIWAFTVRSGTFLLITALNIDLTSRAVMPDQELRGSTNYWEGAVDYSGTQKGVGYVEMTGYEGPVKL